MWLASLTDGGMGRDEEEEWNAVCADSKGGSRRGRMLAMIWLWISKYGLVVYTNWHSSFSLLSDLFV